MRLRLLTALAPLLVASSCSTGWRPPEGTVARVDRSGRVVWRSSAHRTAFDSEPVLRDGTVHVNAYAACGRQVVTHYDPRSGAPAHGTLADLSAPVVDGGLAFAPQLGAGPIAPTVGTPTVPGGFGVLAVDASTGAPRWLTAAFSQGQPRLAAAGGVVAVVVLDTPTSVGLTLRILSADDGHELWRMTGDPHYPPGQVAIHRFERQVPILGGGNLYLVDAGGGLEARDARTGAPRWRVGPASGPVAAGATMVVAHDGGDLVAYDHRGRRLWRAHVVGGMTAVFPAVAGNSVYVAASHGAPCPPSD